MSERKIHSEGTFAHYVTFSCFKRRKFLNPDLSKQIMLGCLSAQLRRQKGICTGFVVMPDHFHAVVWFPEEDQISLFMNKFKDVTSTRILELYKTRFKKYSETLPDHEHVWQAKYYDFNIFSQSKLREKVNYMHNNPVASGLIKDPCDWKWSSAGFWILGKTVGVNLSWPP
jgi:putative transposase